MCLTDFFSHSNQAEENSSDKMLHNSQFSSVNADQLAEYDLQTQAPVKPIET